MIAPLIAFMIFGIYLWQLHRLFKAMDRCINPVIQAMRSFSDSFYPQSMD